MTRTADLAIRPLAPAAPGDSTRGSAPAAAAEFAVVLDPAFAGFSGHFPGAPVLPAMCHVDLAVRAASLAANAGLELLEIVRARFTRRVAPGEEMTIRVSLRPESSVTSTVAADHFVGGETAARMRLRVVVST